MPSSMRFTASPGIDPASIHCIGFSAGGAVAAKIVSYQKEVVKPAPHGIPQQLRGHPACRSIAPEGSLQGHRDHSRGVVPP
ncbi:MAG: hypothetical protein MZU91_13380 [Desulfosudis oleivorans]|nr:hypothetical protein [Desulfosudis oleivorans]